MALNATSRVLISSTDLSTAALPETQASPAAEPEHADPAPRGDLLFALIASQLQHPVSVHPDAFTVTQSAKPADAAPTNSPRTAGLSAEADRLVEEHTEAQREASEGRDSNKGSILGKVLGRPAPHRALE